MAVDYEQTPVKNNKLNATKLALKELDRLSTTNIVWYLVKRHKFGLVVTWAVVMTVIFAVPTLPSILVSLI